MPGQLFNILNKPVPPNSTARRALEEIGLEARGERQVLVLEIEGRHAKESV